MIRHAELQVALERVQIGDPRKLRNNRIVLPKPFLFYLVVHSRIELSTSWAEAHLPIRQQPDHSSVALGELSYGDLRR